MSDSQLAELRAFAGQHKRLHVEHVPPIPVVNDWFLEVTKDGVLTGEIVSGACTSHVQYDPRFRAVFECGCEFYDNGLHEWLHTVEEFWRVSLRQQQRHRRLGELLQAAEDCTPETHQRVWAEVWRCLGWNVDTAREQYLERRAKHDRAAVTCVVKLPPEVVRWIDARYTTRQEGIATIVANAAGVQ